MNSRDKKLPRRSRIYASPIFEPLQPRVFLSATPAPVLALPSANLAAAVAAEPSDVSPASAAASSSTGNSALPPDQRTFIVTKLDDDDGGDDSGDDGGDDSGGDDGSDDGSSFWDDSSWDSSSTDDSSSGTQPATQPDNGSGDQSTDDQGSQPDNSQTDDSGDDGDEGDEGVDDGSGVICPPAAPSDLNAAATSPTTVQLSWQGDTGNTNVFGIWRMDPGHGWNTIAYVNGNDTSYTDTNLLANTLYAYSVTAYNDGGASGFATPVAVLTPAFPPVGSFHVDPTFSTLSGWSVDPNIPTASDTISITVDGNPLITTSANAARPDLVPVYGSADHGFSVALPSLSVGEHQIDVFATDAETQSNVLIAASSINTNHAPIGSLGQFNGSSFTGWTFDQNAGASPIQIQYTLDGNSPVLVSANVSRSDLTGLLGSSGHGFNVALPQLTAGTHTLSVYAVDSSTDALTLLGRKTTVVANTAGLPSGAMQAPTTTQVKGWARNAATPSASVFVRIDIDNVPGTPFLANSARPDLLPLFHNADLGFSQSLTLSPGEHLITVYMLDTPTSTPTLLSSKIVGAGVPMGTLQITSPTTAKGWVFSPSLGADSATIRLDVDYTPVVLATADVSRPDLTAVIGSPDHGYAVTLPVLPAGTHTIQLLEVDPLTMQTTLIASKVFVTA